MAYFQLPNLQRKVVSSPETSIAIGTGTSDSLMVPQVVLENKHKNVIGNCSAFGLGFSMGDFFQNFCLGHNLWIFIIVTSNNISLNSRTLFVLSECFACVFFQNEWRDVPCGKWFWFPWCLLWYQFPYLFLDIRKIQILRGHGISTWIDSCFHSKDMLCHQNIPPWKYRICPHKRDHFKRKCRLPTIDFRFQGCNSKMCWVIFGSLWSLLSSLTLSFCLHLE